MFKCEIQFKRNIDKVNVYLIHSEMTADDFEKSIMRQGEWVV